MVDILLGRTFIFESLIWSGSSPKSERVRLKDYTNFLAWLQEVLQYMTSDAVPMEFISKFLQDRICKAAKKRMNSSGERRATGRAAHKRKNVDGTDEPPQKKKESGVKNMGPYRSA